LAATGPPGAKTASATFATTTESSSSTESAVRLLSAVDVAAMAVRALRRTARPERHLPGMIAVAASKSPHLGHDEIPSFNSQSLSLYQGFGHLPARGLDDPAEGRPRDVHPFRRLFLIHPLLIREAQRFEFVDRQHDLFELGERDASRLEIGGVRVLSDAAAKGRSGHVQALSKTRPL
jgi:hypothetical protein